MSLYTFFSGKGGVGKTTMAAATAVRMADSGKKTLIVSTDPASNLSDVFERPIGHRIAGIVPSLFAMEIDPDLATEEYREHVIGPMRGVMPPDVMKVLEEQFRSACTVEIASFDRFTDFLGRTDFDAVIFDTAPTGHTIRLLELPVDWSAHIEESAKGSGQTCIGPLPSIQGSKEKYDRAVAAMRDPERTEFVLVCRPEATSVEETVRAHDELSALGIGNFRIVVNGIYPEEAGGPFAGLGNRQRERVRALSASLPYPRQEVQLQAGEVMGVDSLRRFAAIAYDGRPEILQRRFFGEEIFDGFSEPSALSELLAARNGNRMVVLTGKGGVGKTVAACAVAVRMAGEGRKTLLVTTDPAAGEAREKLDALVRRLKDRDRCTLLLVLYAEYTPVFEAKRASEDLRDAGIDVQGVIANFVLEEKDCSTPFAASRFRMQQHYLGVAEETFRLPIFRVPMLEAEPAGKKALERVGRELLGPENIVTAGQGTAGSLRGGR